MERHADVAERQWLTVWRRLDRDVRPEPPLEERPARIGAEVGLASRSRVIPVSVRDHRTFNRSPGVDMEPAGLTEEAGGCFSQHAGGT